MDPRTATATRPQSRYPFPNQLSASTCLPALWRTTLGRARKGLLHDAPPCLAPTPKLWALEPELRKVGCPTPCLLPAPRSWGWSFLSQVASNTPPSHTTSAFHLTNLQASGQGQDTRDSPLAQHKLQCPRPVPHPSHPHVQPPPAQCYSRTDVSICVNIYFCVNNTTK